MVDKPWSAKDIAEFFHVKEQTAYDYMKTMPCVVCGKTKVVMEKDFCAWIESHKVQPLDNEHTVVSINKKSRRPRRIVLDDRFEPDGRIKRRTV